MSDNIELVIKIPEKIYKYVQLVGSVNTLDTQQVANAIFDAVPLPKGHGRLIILSEDAVKREQTPLGLSCQSWISEVGLSNATVAIIEADKENEK